MGRSINIFKNWKLSAKLNVALVIILSLTLLIVSLVVINRVQNLTRLSGQQQVSEEIRLVAQHFAEKETELLVAANSLTNFRDLVEAVAAENQPQIQTQASIAFGRFQLDDLDIVNAEGENLITLTEEEVEFDEEEEAGLLAYGLLGITLAGVNTEGDDFLLSVTAPMRDRTSGQIVGAILISQAMDDAFMQELNFNRSQVQLSLIYENEPFAHSHIPQEGEETPDVDIINFLTREQEAAVLNGEVIVREQLALSDNNSRFPQAIGFAPLMVNDQPAAIVGVQVDMSELAALQQQLVENATTIVAVLMLMAMIFGFIFSRRAIANPLRQLQNAAEEIGGGNLDFPIPQRGRDEVGLLGASFAQMAAQLKSTLDNLNARQADLELAARIGGQISQMRDLDSLLLESLESIRAGFGLYYAQIYLTGADGRQLKLAAGTGEAGATLMRRGHQLAVGPGSINGSAASRREVVVVPDTANSPIFRPNPVLPETRSEMAIPMIASNQLLGVMNLQDSRPNSLSGENLAAFEALASQLAVAVENLRLFAQTTAAREALEEQAQFVARIGWNEFLDAVNRREWLGYAYDADQVQPLVDEVDVETETAGLATPIAVAGEPIGTIRVESEDERPLTPEEADLVNAVARQVAERVENLRLLAEADRYRDEAEAAARRLSFAGWQKFRETADEATLGYVFDHNQVQPVAEDSPDVALTQELIVQGEKIGELALADVDGTDEQTTELVQAVADQLSLHLDNLRLAAQTEAAFAETAEQARRLAALNEMANELGAVNTLDDAFTAVAQHMENIVAHDRLSLTLLEPDGEHLQVFALSGESGVTPTGITISAAGSAIGQAIAQRQLINTPDIAQRDGGENGEAAAPEMRASMVAPLITARGVLGTLNLGSNVSSAFDEQDETIMQQIAPLLASTIENQSLFTAAQKQAEKEHLVNVITQKIQGTVTMESALQTAVKELGQAFQAQYTGVILTKPNKEKGN